MTEEKDMSGDLSQPRQELPTNSEPVTTNAQLAHEESIKLTAELFEHAPVGYVVFDRRGKIKKVNHAAARMLGRQKHEIEARPILDCFAKSSLPEFFDHVAKVSVLRKKQVCHVELLRSNGTPFKAQVVTTPINKPSGDFVHYQAIVVDITDHKWTPDK